MSEYKPKFKQKELHAITKKFLSTDWEKCTTDPIKYEWVPNPRVGTGYVRVFFSLYDPNDKDNMLDKDACYYLCLPMRPYEIGYKAYIAELKEEVLGKGNNQS